MADPELKQQLIEMIKLHAFAQVFLTLAFLNRRR